jgi:hypothetical protein
MINLGTITSFQRKNTLSQINMEVVRGECNGDMMRHMYMFILYDADDYEQQHDLGLSGNRDFFHAV